MFKSHEKFHSTNGKRLVLVVDDEFVNRELLKHVLQEDYEVDFAENGEEALKKMHANKDSLSLVLLDLMMPVVSGTEVLRRAKADPEINQIPIIVLTADQGAEVESLTLGAADFIPKPYPQPSVVQARILKTIELSEDRQIISSTERDPLTGLYNREFFYSYAEQYDQHHKDTPMDAIVVDVNHFHMVNERFGTAYGDKVLHDISTALREEVADLQGIVCRREADTFLVYCPHGLDYAQVLQNTTAKVADAEIKEMRLWLRMGVYENVDKGMQLERRFDRAKMAADTVRGSFTKLIGYYDSTLHDRELYQEQLIGDFDEAIRDHQFQVYFQPKFDIQTDIPVLASAEALVRWTHPTLGMISPGAFIPLFEDNGLIQNLDLYVWRETAAHIRTWYDRFDFAVPVSVNVSRVDMYDPHLVETLLDVLAENNLTPRDLLLEITESAYTQDSEQIIATVNKLRRLGFRVEMDDFGTGYSSLNMISTLPIDALKMDMGLIRTAFSEDGDTKMLTVVMDIAEHLSIPVIAEGVETEAQVNALKAMGCDFVQGYYFSRPVPADEYEHFVVERKNIAAAHDPDGLAALGLAGARGQRSFEDVAQALSTGFERICYVDTESNHYVEFSSRGKRDDLQIENSGADFFGAPLKRLLGQVYPEDSVRVNCTLERTALLTQLAAVTPFFLTYRVVVDGAPVFYSLEAARAETHDNHHIVIGVRNVDAQIREANAERRVLGMNFSNFSQALAADVGTMYHIDVDSGAFTMFSLDNSRRELQFQREGDDFFGTCIAEIAAGATAADRAHVASFLQREALLGALARRVSAFATYGTAVDPERQRVVKVAWADYTDRRHMVVGITDAGF